MSAPPVVTVHICACNHPFRTHDDSGCLIPDCICSCPRLIEDAPARYPAVAASPTPVAVPPAPTQTKRCTACGEVKPIDEFYQRRSDGSSRKRLGKCRDCDNSRDRARSMARIVRVRGRHRAIAELVTRHQSEFRELLEYFTKVAKSEADQLATTPRGQEIYGPTEPVRLRSGPKREGQDTEDRIDVARCPECIGHHDRGHVCEACGAAPEHAAKAKSA